MLSINPIKLALELVLMIQNKLDTTIWQSGFFEDKFQL